MVKYSQPQPSYTIYLYSRAVMGEDVDHLRQSLGLRMLKSMDPDIQNILFNSNFVTLYVMKESGSVPI